MGFALPDFELSHCNAVTLKFVDKIGGHLVIRSIVIKEIGNAKIRKVDNNIYIIIYFEQNRTSKLLMTIDQMTA